MRDVRRDYARGTWAYAIGRPADDHPQYMTAVMMAVRGGWNAWWIRTWQDVEATLQGCWFDEETAAAKADFFPKWLRHSKGRWHKQPFVLMDWQRFDVVMPLFGWMRPDGFRRYRSAYIEVPKKNGKSALCSGLGLLLLVKDGEGGAEVYSAAGDRHQAGFVHDESANMVKQSEALSKRLMVIDSKKCIKYPEKYGRFEALSAEPELAEGLHWHGLIFDELHVQKNRKFWDTLIYGGIARDQSLRIAITTAGVYDITSIGWEEHQYAQKVNAGEIIDHTHFTYIAAADKDDEWSSIETYKKANPSYGVTMSSDEITSTIMQVKETPGKQNNFKRYRLNIWTNQSERLVTAELWNKCATRHDNLAESLIGQQCYGGLDLSMSRDMTALILWFPKTAEAPHRWLSWFWLPDENIDELAKQSRAPYRQWVNEGHIELTHGPVIDYARIREVICGLKEKYDIQSIGYDPYNATETSILLRDMYGDKFMIEVRQGMLTLGPATKYTIDQMEMGLVEHDNRPPYTWHASNAQGYTDKQGNTMTVKADGKARLKVDGFVATVIAGSVVMREIGEDKQSVYEERGIISVGDLVDEV